MSNQFLSLITWLSNLLCVRLFLPPFILLFNCLNLFFFRKWLGPKGLFYTSTVALLITLLTSILLLIDQVINSYYVYVDLGRWFYVLDLLDSNLVFISDNLSLITAILVVFLTIFAQYFGVEYMYREAFIIRLVYLLNMFATSVVFLFFVYDFFLILIVWELIGLFSLLLVNFYSSRLYTIKAALKTFIFSRLSDLFIFIAFMFFISVMNTTDFSILFLQIPFFMFFNLYVGPIGFNLLNVLGVLIAASGAVKAAQFLFHVWLPDAMEAPTPASALIHSSTLVIMGIYLVVRFNILFEFAYSANFFMAVLGALTIAVGAISASFQNDIKKLVAYSTVSQMGYLFCGCGFMCYNEVMFYLALHALNKAFLFILVGYIVHFFAGNTDLRFMGALYTSAFEFVFILIVISLNLTGLPYTSGYLAKELLVFQTFRDDLLTLFVRSCWFISFFLTPVYMLFLNIYVVFGSKQSSVKLVTNLHAHLYQLSPQQNYNRIQHSLLTARSTTVVLTLVLTIVLFSGETLLNIVLDSSSSYSSVLAHSWLSDSTSILQSNLLPSASSMQLLSYLVLFLAASALRFLYNLRRLTF